MQAGRKPIASRTRAIRPWREYLEVTVVIVSITLLGELLSFGYRALGSVYLLGVILLCLRVGRWPIFYAAVISALAWNFVFMPPRLSFSVFLLEDALMLGTYFVVALIAGQLTARIRADEIEKAKGEQRATALFHLTRALAAARDLDEAVGSALQQADALFEAKTALLLAGENDELTVHGAGSLTIGQKERAVAEWVRRQNREAGRFSREFPESPALYVPLARADVVLGVFVVAIEPEATLASDQHELIEAFAAQIALSIERERLREASAREKLLAASNRLHRTLLDSVSHELKTPLAVLRSAADGLSRESSPRTLVLAGEIRTATERLDRLVANLLHQTRLESGTISPHLVPCDIHDIVLGARKTIEEPLQGRTVEVDIPADPMLVMADAPLLEHALANLLHNAVLYTPLETPISISAVSEPSSARVAITVADRGPGIPAEVRAHPFQKFRRGNEARTGGLGLGLSIVHGLVVAQGGEIAVDDNPAGGARFTIRLPAVPCDEVPNE